MFSEGLYFPFQAIEAVEWIERNAAPDADVVIYAGDFNTESGDLPHRYGSLVFVHDFRQTALLQFIKLIV